MALTTPPDFADGILTPPKLQQLSDAITQRTLLVAYKTLDETLISNITVQNDDELFLPVEANARYLFELAIASTSAPAADIKIGWTLPALSTNSLWFDVFDIALNRTLGFQTTVPSTGIGMGGNTTALSSRLWGVVVTAATAGTMQVVWAQNTSTASNTSILAGSYLTLLRSA